MTWYGVIQPTDSYHDLSLPFLLLYHSDSTVSHRLNHIATPTLPVLTSRYLLSSLTLVWLARVFFVITTNRDCLSLCTQPRRKGGLTNHEYHPSFHLFHPCFLTVPLQSNMTMTLSSSCLDVSCMTSVLRSWPRMKLPVWNPSTV